jgi:hypothetical protein
MLKYGGGTLRSAPRTTSALAERMHMLLPARVGMRGVLFAIGVGGCMGAPAAAQTSVGTARCPADANPDDVYHRATAYGPRDGRCEGFYAKLVAGGAPELSIVSLTTTTQTFDPRVARAVDISWDYAADAPITVVAMSTMKGSQYMMSASVAPPERHFVWPMGMIRQNTSLTGSSVGIIAYTPLRIGPLQHSVLVPIEVRDADAPAVRQRPTVTIVPDRPLTGLTSSLARADPATGAEASVFENREEHAAPYAAQSPIRIALPASLPAGIYHLRISGRYSDPAARGGAEGTSATVRDLWFVITGAQAR